LKYKFPGPIQWSAINSVCFLLAVQVFYYSSTIALAVAFLDQAYPIRDLSYMAGTLLVLTAEILVIGALIGLFMGTYQGEALYQMGVKRKIWLWTTIAGAAGGYGFFIYTQFIRAYLTGLQTLFDPTILQCIVSAAVMCIGPWYVLYRQRMNSNLWFASTIIAFGAAMFATYALRHVVLWALAATVAIGVVHSAMLYRSLVHMRLRSITMAQDGR
jgi:hypothetical protein